MKSKLINDGLQKTWALILDPGDEVVQNLKQFAREKELSATQFTAIGAFSDVVLGFFVIETSRYKHIPVTEQVEVLSLVGDVAASDEGPKIHAHVVVGKSDGTAHGGHLIEAHVRPTLEVILTESAGFLQRRYNPAAGLALVDLAAG